MTSTSAARLKRAVSMLTTNPTRGIVKGAVAEAAYHPHGLCNQMCGQHIFVKYFEGGKAIVFNQIRGDIHKCPNYERAKLYGALANTIPIAWIQETVDKLAAGLWTTYRPEHPFVKLAEELDKKLKDKTQANEDIVEAWQEEERKRSNI